MATSCPKETSAAAKSRRLRGSAGPAGSMRGMANEHHKQPRCFYCDLLLTDEEARINLPGGQIFGPCCIDAVQSALQLIASE